MVKWRLGQCIIIPNIITDTGLLIPLLDVIALALKIFPGTRVETESKILDLRCVCFETEVFIHDCADLSLCALSWICHHAELSYSYLSTNRLMQQIHNVLALVHSARGVVLDCCS